MSDEIHILTRKIDDFITTVNTYHNGITATISGHGKDITQIKEKVVQLFDFHNNSIKEFEKVRKLVSDNRHELVNIKNVDRQQSDVVDTLKDDFEKGMEATRESIYEINKSLEARENQKAGAMVWVKAFAGSMAILGSVGGFGAFIYMVVS